MTRAHAAFAVADVAVVLTVSSAGAGAIAGAGGRVVVFVVFVVGARHFWRHRVSVHGQIRWSDRWACVV